MINRKLVGASHYMNKDMRHIVLKLLLLRRIKRGRPTLMR